ncbi:hypothetical protein [Phyllobacterium leguminum]|uniref:Uncharacterized protein n=1 Tax=Phyllobacterium leguminum TaxID=314237 RepID=A0A318T169_9HYPH|nr:hypothetical protein [Phyllobacterium leguminum]PYE87530.1 hypothetical protein C7477_11231 [Phyllobacterium leguminum]
MERYAPGEIPTMVLQCLSDGSCRTVDEIGAVLPLSRRQIWGGASILIKRDYLDRTERGCYRLTQAGLNAAANGEKIAGGPIGPDTCIARKPLQNTLRQRAWNAIRISPSFTVGDIVMAAARDERYPDIAVRQYIRLLRRAGYVAELPTRQRGTHRNGGSSKRFRLVKDTGPISPAWRTHKGALWDYNLRQFAEEVSCDK